MSERPLLRIKWPETSVFSAARNLCVTFPLKDMRTQLGVVMAGVWHYMFSPFGSCVMHNNCPFIPGNNHRLNKFPQGQEKEDEVLGSSFGIGEMHTLPSSKVHRIK